MMFYSGIFSIVVLVASCYFCFDIINKIPRDVGRILTEYRDKKWQDFFVTLSITSLFWIVTVLLLIFVIAPFVSSFIYMLSRIFTLE